MTTIYSIPKNWGFRVESADVYRDESQSRFGNRMEFSDALEYYVAALADGTTAVIEVGGAHPQVYAKFLNKDPMEVFRMLREKFPNITLRPLFRGANGYNLMPQAEEVLEYILEQMAMDVAVGHEDGRKELLLLLIKVFDSQAVLKEVESTVRMVSKLYHEKGYRIGVEIAIPYSDGRGVDPERPDWNAYPDKFFIGKFVEAAKLLQKYDIPQDLAHISLKDMIGELDAVNAERLVRGIIEALKAENLYVPLAVHLHETGLAADAYAAVIDVCKELDWPVRVDTVGGCNTGFVSKTKLKEALMRRNQDLVVPGITDKDHTEADNNIDQIEEQYELVRATGTLSNEKLREYKIPGGGLASFETAVNNGNNGFILSDRLEITKAEALEVAGMALVTVGKLTGFPFAVTPGFQNKQIAALHMLEKMVTQNYLTPGMTLEQIKEKLYCTLSDDQVREFFIEGIRNDFALKAVANFLCGTMPAEDSVHPLVRKAFPIREGLLTDNVRSELPNAKKLVSEYLELGIIRPTLTQARTILQRYSKDVQQAMDVLESKGLIVESLDGKEFQDWAKICIETLTELGCGRFYIVDKATGKQYQNLEELPIPTSTEERVFEVRNVAQEITKALQDSAFHNAVTWAIILNNAEEFGRNIKRPWLREPKASEFQGNSDGFRRAKERVARKANPNPDRLEKIRAQLIEGSVSLEDTPRHVVAHLVYERYQLEKSIRELISSTAQNAQEIRLDTLVLLVMNKVRELETGLFDAQGRDYAYTQSERINYSLHYLAKLCSLSPEELKQLLGEFKAIQEQSIVSPMEGVIEAILVQGKNCVEKQTVIQLNAMKMTLNIPAPMAGSIALMKKTGDTVSRGELLAFITPFEKIQKPSVISLRKISVDQQHKAPKPTKPEMLSDAQISLTHREQQGYHRGMLSKGYAFHSEEGGTVHVIGNRGGCAAKIKGDLERANQTVVVLYSEGDASTPVVRGSSAAELHKIKHYNDTDALIRALEELAQKHPGKQLVFHPGWGFKSEDAEFVRELARRLPKVQFSGPRADAMERAGGKATFRDLVQDVAPEMNPHYFFLSPNLPIQEVNRRVHEELGGDVVIKAVAGGGGRGIRFFQAGQGQYLDGLIEEVKRDAATLFHNDQILIEQCIRGEAHHVEAQVLLANGQRLVAGYRECSVQNDKHQKFLEMNILFGDFPEEVMVKLKQGVEKIAQKLAEIGYTGVVTLEMMVTQLNGVWDVKILEANTRVQVEHGVTEMAIRNKTGKEISIPLLNYHLSHPVNKQEGPADILERIHGLTREDIEKISKDDCERLLHFRIVSQYVNPETGKFEPSYCRDTMWPVEITTFLARKYPHLVFIQGGLGDGKSDPQIGTVYGPKNQVIEAVTILNNFFRMSAMFERKQTDKTNLEFALALVPNLFDDQGNIKHQCGTRLVGSLLKAIQEHKIEGIPYDPNYCIWPGAANLTPDTVGKLLESLWAYEQGSPKIYVPTPDMSGEAGMEDTKQQSRAAAFASRSNQEAKDKVLMQ